MLHAKNFQVLVKIFEGFCHILPWWPSWSNDLDHLYKLSFHLPMEAPHLALISEEKMFENGGR